MAVLHQNSGIIGRSTPSVLEISLVLMEHGYNTFPYEIIPCNTSLAEPVATKYGHLHVLPTLEMK